MEEQLVRRLVDRFLQTWNAHDAQAFAACFKEDGDFVNVLARKAAGRSAIAKMHEFPFTRTQAKATASMENLELRALDDRFLVADFWWKVVGSQTPSGEPLPERYGLICFVIEVAAGEALFVTGRNMDFTVSYGREAGAPPRS